LNFPTPFQFTAGQIWPKNNFLPNGSSQAGSEKIVVLARVRILVTSIICVIMAMVINTGMLNLGVIENHAKVLL
jgi:hypothetical protein